MIKKALLGWLRAAVRTARRRLGEPAGFIEAEPAPDFLRWAEAPPRYVTEFRRGTLVFELLYVTAGSGGMADVLDLGLALEDKFGLDVFYRVPPEWYDRDEAIRRIRWARPAVRAGQVLAELDFVPEYLCATAWPTAYRVRSQPSGRKLYFVQDYEPWFRPAGMERWYAAHSYELGLEIITLGPWLAEWIRREHGVEAAVVLPFPMVDRPAAGRPWERRDRISFYVQPEKTHRGTELLLETARRLAGGGATVGRTVEVVLFGSRELEYMQFDFPCRVLGVLSEDELRELMRRTRVGVSASFSNLALLPFRFVAHGAWSVELDLPNVSRNLTENVRSAFRLVPPEPCEMVAAVAKALAEPPRLGAAELAAAYEEHSWDACAAAVGRGGRGTEVGGRRSADYAKATSAREVGRRRSW